MTTLRLAVTPTRRGARSRSVSRFRLGRRGTATKTGCDRRTPGDPCVANAIAPPMPFPEMNPIVSVIRASCRSGEFLAAVVRDQGSGRQTAGQLAWAPAVSHRKDKPSSDGVALVDRYFKYGASVEAPALEEPREIEGGLVSRLVAVAGLVPTYLFVVGTDRA